MTTTLARPAATRQDAPKEHPQRATLRLYARLIRRSTLLLALSMGAYAALEIASYQRAYPDGISPLQFALFEDNPAVRVMNGVPYALDSPGGFTVWDAGWIWQLLLGIWAILVTTRFLRGEEDLDRGDLLLAKPITATRVTALVLAVVIAAGLLVSIVVSATMLLLGEAATGSLLVGAGLAGFTATFAGIAAVVCQLVEVRRRAAAVAAGVLGLAYLLRMVGNSSDSWLWVRWTTPFGWMEELRAFGDPRFIALAPLLAAPVLLALLAVRLRSRRDIGAAMLSPESRRTARTGMLGSPLAFAWRSNRAVLLAWLVGLAFYAVVMGALVTTMVDWITGDEGYRELMAQMGLDETVSIKGFIGMIGMIMGLAVMLQVSWRIGAARAEEEGGRLEAILARPVPRLRWLGGHVLLAALGAVLLLAVMGVAMWLGAAAAGSQDITLGDTVRAMLNTLPVVAVVGGLAVCTFGILPRLTVAVPVAVTVVGLVLYLLGPALGWPQLVLNLSPFAHLAMVPAEPWAGTSAAVMTLLGIALCGIGMLAFQRRDVETA